MQLGRSAIDVEVFYLELLEYVVRSCYVTFPEPEGWGGMGRRACADVL